jgi:DNA-binding response OmpR family regulator
MDDYVSKPVSMKELASAIEKSFKQQIDLDGSI